MEEPIAKNIFAMGSVINLENFNQRIPGYKLIITSLNLYSIPWVSTANSSSIWTHVANLPRGFQGPENIA